MRTALRTIILAIREAWSPSTLFEASEVGVWYDPSDWANTCFQDSAGTTAAAIESPVGLLLDKSKGLTLGAELVTNGDFSDGDTGWTSPNGATLSIVSGKFRVQSDAIGYGNGFQAITTVIGSTYQVTFNAYDGTAPALVRIENTPDIDLTATNTTVIFRANTISTKISLYVNSGVIGQYAEFDNISVRELPGQHSKQATSTSRPTLKATPSRIDYDAVDDTLVATFASSLGADCTVCRAVSGVGASILTAQNIGTSYTDNTDHCGLIIVNRALTAGETSSVTAYLNAKAGV